MLRVFLRILATLVAFAAHGCCSSPLPSLSIPRCNVGAPAALDGLSRSDGSAPFPAGTSISLCWTPDSLVLEYHCLDDRFLRNDFLECNSPMYNQVAARLLRSRACFVALHLSIRVTVFCSLAGGCGGFRSPPRVTGPAALPGSRDHAALSAGLFPHFQPLPQRHHLPHAG